MLGERLRSEEERLQVRMVIEKFCKVKLDFNAMYPEPNLPNLEKIVWTNSMKRLFSLVQVCALKKEPCLIVGETGLGKTTCIQS